MAHQTVKDGYHQLSERLNRFPQGAAPTRLLFEILRVLMSEKEAGLVALLPIKPFSVETAARAWKLSPLEAQKNLETLASRAILLDTVNPDGKTTYVLPPPMAGFFEFSIMRLRTDVDQKLLSELYYQYITVEDDFIKSLFTRGETQLGRVFVSEPALSSPVSLQVLDYERSSQVIQTASCIGVGLCYCRHKLSHLDQACQAPLDICMTFNGTAASLTRHGFAREVDAAECMDLLQQAYDQHLVQFGENVRKSVNFICNCCGCCCEAMLAARRFAFLNPVHTTNYLPVIQAELCNGCGKCAAACPVEAMSMVSAHDPRHPNQRKAHLEPGLCLGCGLCVRTCAPAGIHLQARPERVITPLDSAHKSVVMAIERGMLQNLIFDNQALSSHRAMAAILGVILKLPPLQQIMASRQMKSRYLETLLEWAEKRYLA